MRLLDTDVLVDDVRGFPPALRWLASLTEQPKISGIVLMELVEGCANKLEMLRVQKMVEPYVLCWPAPSDNQNALTILIQARLSHHIGLQDALIAATALGLGATLCTFNTKHFSAVPGLITEQPYERG